jgi:hypothetical protein
MRLVSQNCGLYRPIVHPRVICDVNHGTTILTEVNFQLVYHSAMAATSTVGRSCQQRHLWQPPVLSGGPVSRDSFGSHQYWLAVLSAETSLEATSTVWRSCQPRHLWKPPVLAGGSVSRDISGSHQYCPAVLPAETSLERVGEWVKEMRI